MESMEMNLHLGDWEYMRISDFYFFVLAIILKKYFRSKIYTVKC